MSSRYEKGANFERALVEKFQKEGFIAMRAAGSGTIKFVIPDVVAIKGEKIFLIECKTTKKKSLSLKEPILSLKKILPISRKAKIFLAVKFPREKARFFPLKKLGKKKNFTISIKDNEYLTFEDILRM
jgi:Holliday junction resolvase